VPVVSDAADPIAHLAERIAQALPELGHGIVAMVDSPAVERVSPDRERDLDTMLRATVACLNQSRPRGEWINLALFPTPIRDDFMGFAAAVDCKPHLSRIARRLFGTSATGRSVGPSRGGRIFTRFMLSGFAAHLALASIGATVFESYPYLAFSTWRMPGEMLPPKRHRRQAMSARRDIIVSLGFEYGVAVPEPTGLDQADAAILALTAAIGSRGEEGVLLLESDAHGRFLLPLPAHEMRIVTAGLSLRA
jgi:hypothetical protein